MLLTVILSLLSVIIIVLSYIIMKTGKITGKTQSAIILCGFAIQLTAIIASFFAGNGFLSMSIAVAAADLFIGLPKILSGRIKNKKIVCFVKKSKKWLTGIAAGTALVLLVETFICNFGALNLIAPSSPNEMILPLNRAAVNGSVNSSDVITVNSGESVQIEFSDVNYEIKNIYMDIESENSVGGKVRIYNSDETSRDMRNVSNLEYINGNESSKYIVCSYFGKVGSISFQVSADENSIVTVKGISVNKHIPFDFSWLRFFIILGFVLFAVTIAFCPYMKKSCGQSKTFKISAAAVTLIFVSIAVCLLSVRGDMIFGLFDKPDTNQMNKELVDAFEAGQVSLIETPSQEMLNLENPYDLSERSAAGVSYPWDHLLFEGKYYSYYGIGTVLTLFLPYHMITGKYFPSLWATFIYSIIGIVFLSLAYCAFMRRLFPKIPNGTAISGLVIVQAASFVWYCITIGNFYELAQVSGFAFLIAGMYFLLRSGVVGEGKISRPNICIAAILLSISVLCRAALALYCIVSLLFIYAGVKKIIKTSKEQTFKANKKPIITFLLAALLPFVIIGSVQMVYNYLRFGSILDFGISYTLTIYDYQHIQFHLPLVFIAIFNYLFTLPKVSSVFPFVTSNYDSLSVNGYYFLAGFSSAGIIFRAIPVLGYVFGRRAYKRSENPNRRLAAVIIILGCILVPLIQMAMIWEYGYTPRYAVDFAWQMIFGAFAVLFVLYGKMNITKKRIMNKVFLVSAIIAVIINFALTYEFVLDYGNSLGGIPMEIRSDMVSFGRLFEFWNIM